LVVISTAIVVIGILVLWENPIARMVMTLCLAMLAIGLVKEVVFRVANGRWRQPGERTD
jgi:hypothetical protein